MKTKKGDFIELDYVAREKESGKVFDLTLKDVAEKEGILNPNFNYSPVKICLGEHDVIPGLDEALIGLEPNKSIELDIPAEKAFGKREPKLVHLFATNKLLKQKIRPAPGMQLNIDGMIGVVKSVSGGRTLIDFNHPLAGRNVHYFATIKKIIEKPEDQLEAILDFHVKQGIKSSLKDSVATIHLSLPQEFQSKLEEKIKHLIPSIKQVNFKSDSES